MANLLLDRKETEALHSQFKLYDNKSSNKISFYNMLIIFKCKHFHKQLKFEKIFIIDMNYDVT